MSSAILLQTSLEAIDKPYIPAQPAASGSSSSGVGSGSGSTGLTPPASPPKGRRISPLPPMPTVPRAAGSSSKGPQRYLFIAVRRGHRPGVYTEWTQAEVQLSNHPDPHYKTFSTRLAAEAFVAGWDGAGRHSLPRSSPRTLREHLAMSFPNSVASPSSTSRRQSYHERILAAQAFGTDERHLDGLAISGMSASASVQAGRSQSFRYSQVKVSSPLRMQVGDDDSEGAASGTEGAMRRMQSYMGLGGLLSPPLSPTDKQVSVMDRQRPTKPRDVSEGAPWSARSHREFRKPSAKATGLLSPPDSPVLSAGGADGAAAARGSQPPPPSGLWADCKPTTSSPLSPLALGPPVDLLGGANPKKFSRSGLKKSGVIMPVAAPRAPSSSSLSTLGSLSKRASQSSLFSASNSSLVSLASTSGAGDRSRTMPRKQLSTPSFRGSSLSSQDRLGSLAETSRRELQVDEHGVLALEPPRPSFMGMRRQQSNSSLDSTSSAQSFCSLTSGTSAPSSPAASDAGSDDYSRGGQYFGRPITAEPGLQVHELAEIPETHEVLAFDHVISCTKSDGDADGSSEGGSVKSGATGSFAKREKKSGGLFKRFSKALKLDKKTVAGQDNGRRPSV